MTHAFNIEKQEHALALSVQEMATLLAALDTLASANNYNPSMSIAGFGKSLHIANLHFTLKQVTNL